MNIKANGLLNRALRKISHWSNSCIPAITIPKSQSELANLYASCVLSRFWSPAFWLLNRDDQGERVQLGVSNSLIALKVFKQQE